MILSFKCSRLKKFHKNNRSKIAPAHHTKVDIILQALATAKTVYDMDMPGFNLHSYTEFNPKRWSVDVSGNYRIHFEFENGNAQNVDYIDPH